MSMFPMMTWTQQLSLTMEATELKIVSFNMHGFNQGCVAIDELIRNYTPDIFLIQEHWLTPANLCKLDIFSSYAAFGCSAMTDTIESGILRGRPFGGVSILINNNIHSLCKTITCSERYVIVKVANYIIVSIYLPCVGTIDRLLICEDVLNDIWAWVSQHPECECIIAGDFNVDLDSADPVANIINNFRHDYSMIRCDSLFGKPKRDTYSNLALNHHSTIDYMLTTLASNVINFDILDPDINFSDHLPLMCTVEISFDSLGRTTSGSKHKSHEHSQLRWDHADLASYYRYTGEKLEPILFHLNEVSCKDDESDHQINYSSIIDRIYNDLVHTLAIGANRFVPHCRKNFFKFWWDEEMDLLKEASIESNLIWKAANKPKHGPIFSKRQSCRLQYRKRIRENQTNEMSAYSNDLHEALMEKMALLSGKFGARNLRAKTSR